MSSSSAGELRQDLAGYTNLMAVRASSASFALAGVAALASAAAILANAGLRPTSQLFGRTLVAGADPDEVVLTFDDGPNEPATQQLLDVLARAGVHAAFFMIGRFARQRPDLVRAVHAAGHTVGNHTETHPWLIRESGRRIREELRACNEALEDALGEPVRFFRPPHGARRPAVLQAAEELNLTTVQWNVMGYDWQKGGPDAILGRLDRGLRRARRSGRGANIVLHDGWDAAFGGDRHTTVEATAALLARLPKQGYRFTTLDAWMPQP